MRFSFGFDLSEPVRDAIVMMPETAWVKAIRADGTEREHSQVCEITDRVDLSSWPEGSRLIARRTKLREGDQQSFADHDGYRLAVFLTDQTGDDVPQLDLTHRGHARVEGRIRPGQGLRPAQPPVQELSPQPGVAVAGDARPRPDRLDSAAVPHRRHARVGAQAVALPAAAPVRADRPPRPPADPAPRARLALVKPARRSVRAAASAAATRLTATGGPPTTTIGPTADVSLPGNLLHVTAPPPELLPGGRHGTGDTPINAKTGSAEPDLPGRFRYCKPTDSAATARSRLVGAGTVLGLLVEPVQSYFQAIEHMHYRALLDAISRGAQCLIGAALAVAGFGAFGIAGGVLVTMAVVLVLGLRWARRYVRLELRTTWRDLRELARGSLAYWAATVFFMIYLWIDTAMLSVMTNPTVVGWYGVPTRLFQTLFFLPGLIATVWLPRLVRAAEPAP